jgi:hypothetical protein
MIKRRTGPTIVSLWSRFLRGSLKKSPIFGAGEDEKELEIA